MQAWDNKWVALYGFPLKFYILTCVPGDVHGRPIRNVSFQVQIQIKEGVGEWPSVVACTAIHCQFRICHALAISLPSAYPAISRNVPPS